MQKNNHSGGDLYGYNGDEVSRKQRKMLKENSNKCKNMVFILCQRIGLSIESALIIFSFSFFLRFDHHYFVPAIFPCRRTAFG
jgi:hypothetical protein